MRSLPDWAVFAGAFGVAFAVSWLVTPLAERLGRRLGIVDVPGGRRRHQGPVPRLGGVAIFAGFMAGVLATLFYPRTPADAYRLTGLLLGCGVVFAGGLIDDRRQLPALPQMVILVVGALVAIRYWVFIERVNNPFTDQQVVFPLGVTIVLTLLWMGGITTAVAWLDGLDGLATGVSAIAVLVFSVHMLRTGQASVALLPLALLGATLGFLPRNLPPARIFIGSSGSYFLGFAVGALAIVGGARAATALLVMGVPLVDVFWQVVDRIRHGRSPVVGDRGHLHFRLVDMGVPQGRIVLLYYGISAVLGAIALVMPSRWFKFLALMTLGVVVAGLLGVLTWLGERRGQPGPEDH